jgi:acyl-CoA synthetase (AMP-forming)/AMP-acid ligase II
MMRFRTLSQALAEAATGKEGYTFVTAHGEIRRSYADMQEASFRVARSIREAGLRRGDLVALVIGDAEQFLTTLLGVSVAGVIPASLYPPATTSDLGRYLDLTAGILRGAGARGVVTTSALAPAFGGLQRTCPDLELVLSCDDLNAPALEPDSLPSLDDIAFVQFTSGSTSSPKGVALTHRNLSANVDAINSPAGLSTTSDDVGVSWLPLYHDMGLVGMALGAVYSGRPVVMLTPQMFVKRPAEWLRAMSRYGGTISFAPTFAYDLAVRRVKDRDLADLNLSRWRVAGCGAEPIHAPTLAAFAARFASVGFRATSFLPSYGLAEHVLAATFPVRNRAPRVEEIAADELTERRLATPAEDGDPSIPLVSCGRALPGHAIRIVGEDGRELAERQVGEITLGGPSVMLGYYRDQALTAQTIRRGWLHTGDLGYLSDGELFVCGRVKDVIIVNGRKYHPQDLEWAVNDVTGVRRGRVVAFGTTEPGAPDRVVVVVEPSGTASVGSLTDSIRRRIGDLFGLFVDEVVAVPSGAIGRTTSGKVQRAATKARYERGTLVGQPTDEAGLRA